MPDPFVLTLALMALFVAMSNEVPRWMNGHSCVRCGARSPDRHSKECPERKR